MKTYLISTLLDLIYAIVCLLRLPVVIWRRVARGRSLGNPLQRVLGLVPRSKSGPVVWLHAVSVGEVNQLGIVIEHLARRCPDCRFVISTTTATGMQVLRKKHPDLQVFWFPIDFSWAVRTALRRVRPALLVLTELELWPNLLSAAARESVDVAVINGRLSERSWRGYLRAGRLSQRMFASLSLVLAQNHTYAGRFKSLGVPEARIRVAGSLKYDQAARQAAACSRDSDVRGALRALIDLRDGECLLVAGSTQEEEDLMAIALYRSLSARYPALRLVVVPRHPHRAAEVVARIAAAGLVAVRRSALREWPWTPAGEPAPVLVVDSVGELGQWWSLAHVAFVGGTMGSRGGQNMLEPAAAGCATCYGPHTWNFAQIVDEMSDGDAGVVVRNQGELEAFVARCLDEPEWMAALGKRATALVARNQGAADRTAACLAELLARRETVAPFRRTHPLRGITVAENARAG